MAETLGSLIDKLTIKKIRLSYLGNEGASVKIKLARKIVGGQIANLIDEIDTFIESATKGKVLLREKKVKLYKNPPSELNIPDIKSIGKLTDLLMQINLNQWQLEDQIRASNITSKRVVNLKKLIDRSNRNRNDVIDRIDELLEKCLRKS
ncbi:MAG: DUF4254 domain-containing protein [Candidatus Margulisbacteria bacterium]|nr:DUF4254 domain-containing protein [Candidatus Margulisiibacteriota bacterium]